MTSSNFFFNLFVELSQTTSIVLPLPYAKSNTVGVFRAGESGQTIVFDKASPGMYSISVKGFNEGNVLKYEGSTKAQITEGETTTVEIELKRVKNSEDDPINDDPDEPIIEEPEDQEVIEINLLGWTDEQANMIKNTLILIQVVEFILTTMLLKQQMENIQQH